MTTAAERRRRRSMEPGHQRKFLVVVDDTPECDRAIYYASRRAQSTGGGLVMLTVTDPPDPQISRSVEELMRAEAQAAAASALEAAAARARAVSGVEPETRILEGDRTEVIHDVIASDEDIAILVLAAGTGRDGPGPLVSSIAGKAAGSFHIPITIVPGDLGDEEIDALA
jgi:nucleotide-binding universal stress UspA family protein